MNKISHFPRDKHTKIDELCNCAFVLEVIKLPNHVNHSTDCSYEMCYVYTSLSFKAGETGAQKLVRTVYLRDLKEKGQRSDVF